MAEEHGSPLDTYPRVDPHPTPVRTPCLEKYETLVTQADSLYSWWALAVINGMLFAPIKIRNSTESFSRPHDGHFPLCPMLSSKNPAFLATSGSLPTDHDLEKLTCAIRIAAGENDLSTRTIDRYQAWIFGFISWSLRVDPYEVQRDRIGDFWDAILRHPDAGRQQAFEAMDALGFLYGAVNDAEDLLSFSSNSPTDSTSTPHWRRHSEDPVSPQARSETNGEIASITVGWKLGG